MHISFVFQVTIQFVSLTKDDGDIQIWQTLNPIYEYWHRPQTKARVEMLVFVYEIAVTFC